MRKAIDIPEHLVKALQIKAVIAGMSFKAYLEMIIEKHADLKASK